MESSEMVGMVVGLGEVKEVMKGVVKEEVMEEEVLEEADMAKVG